MGTKLSARKNQTEPMQTQTGKPMKTIILVALFALTTTAAFANSGFICPKDKLSISKRVLDAKTSTLEIEHADGKKDTNPLLIAPEGNDTDAYQTRFGIYNEITAETQSYFPYMPEILMVYHMTKSQSLYRKGFRTLDGESTQVIELKSMYCKALVESILHYKP